MSERLMPGTIAVIRATPSVLRALLDGLPDAVVGVAGAEGWLPRDVVGHLVVAGRLGALERASRALTEVRAEFAPYDEESALEASGLRDQPVSELIDLMESERSRCLALTRDLSDDDLERVGVHAEVGPARVGELLHQAAYHDSLHIAQIATLVSGAFESGRGALAAAVPESR